MEARRTLWKTNSLHCTVMLFLAGVSGSVLGSSWADELRSSFSTSIGGAAAVLRERKRGSVFIRDYNKDSKGHLGIFKCKNDLEGWWYWLLTLLSVELQLHIFLQLLSDCFERFLCKTELLEHATGMAAVVKGLGSSWEQSDLHKGPWELPEICTTALSWNPAVASFLSWRGMAWCDSEQKHCPSQMLY